MFARRFGLPATCWKSRFARTNSTIAGTVYYRCSYHNPGALAVSSPHEGIEWKYDELWSNITRVAGGLKSMGYAPGDVIASDLGLSAYNILLQMACAHSGMTVLTVNDAAEFDRLSLAVNVRGAVAKDSSSFLGNVPVEHPILDVEGLKSLQGKLVEGATERKQTLAYYHKPSGTRNREVYLYGVGTAGTLEIEEKDQMCVACSLNDPFGMGSVVAAIVRNASVYIPDMANPDLRGSTIVVTGADTLSKLKVESAPKIRTGIVKTGDGYDLLEEKKQIGNVALWQLDDGLQKKTFRPLWDACVDKYYSYK